jgi:hypothetical protein
LRLWRTPLLATRRHGRHCFFACIVYRRKYCIEGEKEVQEIFFKNRFNKM